MAKDIKCILVDVDKLLISEIEEVDAELGNPNCKLTNPVVFESLERMKPFWRMDVHVRLLTDRFHSRGNGRAPSNA